MHIVKHPSLYLNWLKKLDKTLKLPTIVYADKPTPYGGMFTSPYKGEWWLEGTPIDMSKGLIVIGKSYHETEGTEGNVIAHEFRHLWQWYKGVGMNSPYWDPDGEYQDNIINYFTTSKTEMDALLWSQKKAYCPIADMWIGWLRETK